MAKKSKPTVAAGVDIDSSSANETLQQNSANSKLTAQSPTPNRSTHPQQAPTLVISRNKHWRYISSYHGPWLNLPLEVLESLAYTNYYCPRPRPIDPAIFFDLVRIRRLVDDATGLAVRAANGTAAAALTNPPSSSHGYLHATDAELLGIGSGRGGGAGGPHAKLSRERKHRMREHATQKLSHAYRLDEVATSVATMQSASALDDVAKHVLLRNQEDADAQYVHFFHEKIPSRTLAESTSLRPLTSVIQQQPTEPAPWRTRAVTRIFKDDYLGAAKDLTEGLAVQKLYHISLPNPSQDLILAKDAVKPPKSAVKLDEKDQPTGGEQLMLFHRAGAYLTLACHHIHTALKGLSQQSDLDPSNPADTLISAAPSPQLAEEARTQAQARKLVRTYAKRALRDYTAFISNFDYTPGISPEFTEVFLQRFASARQASADPNPTRSRSERLLDVDLHTRNPCVLSEALTKYDGRSRQNYFASLPELPKPQVHKLSEIFSAVPPSGLPHFPSSDTNAASAFRGNPLSSLPSYTEGATYHPLLPEALHSLLLAHCLIQTSTKEIRRHAYNVARITRTCDGYPVFVSARSPARADWVEVLSRTSNFCNIEKPWEDLCQPRSPIPSCSNPSLNTTSLVGSDKYHSQTDGPLTKGQRLEKFRCEAIREALVDDRNLDEETFRQSVRAREARTVAAEDEEMRREYNCLTFTGSERNLGSKSSQRGAVLAPERNDTPINNNITDYTLVTQRAEAIAQWILEATPSNANINGSGGSSGRRRTARAIHVSTLRNALSDTADLERGVESLDLCC